MTLEPRFDAHGNGSGPFDIGFGAIEADPAIMATGKVGLDAYRSHERFETEREIFGKVWLNLAEGSEIPEPGDWIVRDIAIRSTSVILVRGKDGQIRAFHNMCSHRGMRLAWDKQGRGGRFACPYHAWTFDSSGALLNIPDDACFPMVERQENGLTPIRCELWEDMIFVNLDAQGSQSLVDYLGPVAERIKALPFASYPYRGRAGAHIAANWKLAIEAQCEAYHAGTLHNRTVAKFVVSRENPYGHLFGIELLGAHRMSSTPGNPEFACPSHRLVQAFAMGNVQQLVVDHDGDQHRPDAGFVGHPDINVTQSNMWGLDQYILYPNFIMALSGGGWWLHRFWPLTPETCQWEAVWHFERPLSLRQQFATQATMAFARDALTEDNVAIEQQQKVQGGGGKTMLQFGEQEILCQHLAAVSHSASRLISAVSA